MPAKHSRHIALTSSHAEWIDDLVAKGEYASPSDVIRAALLLLRAQEERRGESSPATAIPSAQQHGHV